MKQIEIVLPAGFHELTPAQLKVISKLLLTRNKSKEYLQIRALNYFSGLKIVKLVGPGIFLCIHKKKKHLIAASDIAYHKDKLNWLCDIPKSFAPLPKLAGRKPVNTILEGTPLSLYLAAENFYQAYLHTEQREYLQCLAAVLYSAGYPFNDQDTSSRHRKFRFTSAAELFTVFLWYSAIKQILAANFPYLFAGTAGTEEQSAPDMRAHINNMIRVLTAGDVTKMESVLSTETWFALFELNEKSREIEEFNQNKKG